MYLNFTVKKSIVRFGAWINVLYVFGTLLGVSLPSINFGQNSTINKTGDSNQNSSNACSFSIGDSIAGNKEGCTFIGIAGGTATYSINAVSASYYDWSVSNTSNMQIVSGQGTPNITIRFAASYTLGSINVKVGNVCGPEIMRTAYIFKGPPPIPGEITGDATACPYINYDTTALYSISKVTNATSYQWTVPQGITIVGRPGGGGTKNDTAIVVKFDNSFVAGTFITVNAVTQCGISSPKNFTIHRSWSPVPEIITGPTNSCVIKVGPSNPTGTPVVYRTNKVRYAVSYTWTVPAGATIISPVIGTSINVKDTSITVLFGSSYSGGYVSVQSVTGCGMSTYRSIPVNDQVLATPAAIYGTLNPCPTIGGPDTTSYRTKKIDDAKSYIWTVPAGAVITAHPGGAGTENDTIILVRWSSAFTTGTIDVNAVNNCMTSTTRSLTITRKMPLAPNGIMSALLKTCPNRHYAYMINAMPVNGNSVVWSVPAGANILSGQGTLSIKVEYDAGAIVGNVTVTGVNSCGLGTPRVLAVALPACPSFRESRELITKTDYDLPADITETLIYPNPSAANFFIKTKVAGKEKIQITIMDMQGRILQQNMYSTNELIKVGNTLNAGMYFLRIIQGDKMITRKIIKL